MLNGKTRLHVEEALLPNVNLEHNPRQSHYVCNVMRLKERDNIVLFKGKDGEWQGEIFKVSRKSVQVRIKEYIRQQQYEKKLYLYCAIIKSAALSSVIRQATEMGVTCIQFILTEHTVVKNINLDRAKLQAIEAAEQSGRINIPEILPP